MHAHRETNGTHRGTDEPGGGSGAPADAGLAAFNALPADVAAARLLECLAVPRWAAEIATGRPYPSVAALRDAATAAGLAMTDDEVVEALSRHPRIGERPAGPGRELSQSQQWSRSEQGGVDAGDAVLAMALRAGNREYEEKFGYVFLIRAAGRSGAEILAALNERLTHEWPQERSAVRRELTEIAVLRLEKVLAGD